MPRRVHPTFATITADPDWMYGNFGAAKHGAARAHYPGTGLVGMQGIPVRRWSRRDTTLFLWATMPKLDLAIDVMRAWGFGLVTGLPWVKTAPTKAELAKGIGFWFYGTAEVLLECRCGNAPAPRYPTPADKPDGLLVGPNKEDCVFYARRGAHSRKPPSLMEWIESYFPGPRLELYATGKKPGWTCWGHQTGHHLDHDGVHSLPRMKFRDYPRWLRCHPVMVKVSAMDDEELAEWRSTPEARETDPRDVLAARCPT